MSDEGRLATADPVAAGYGSGGGVSGPLYGAGHSAHIPVTAEEDAYLAQAVPMSERRGLSPAIELMLALPAPPGPYNPPHRGSSADVLFEDNVEELFEELEQLLLSKHADYGPSNVAGSPGGAINGLRVRVWDKVARINHLLDNDRDPKHESLEDSFKDLANYCVIALLVLRRQWPTA